VVAAAPDIFMFALPVIDAVIGPTAAITTIIPAVVIPLVAAGIAIAPAGPVGAVVLGVIAVVEIGVIAQTAASIAPVFFIIIGRAPITITVAVTGIGYRWQQ
jgi:hypothetical protein